MTEQPFQFAPPTEAMLRADREAKGVAMPDAVLMLAAAHWAQARGLNHETNVLEVYSWMRRHIIHGDMYP